MRNNLAKTLKDFFWYGIANSTIEDAKFALLNNEIFLRRIKNEKDYCIIHLNKRHLPLVVAKVVNGILSEQSYAVTSIRYCYHGMDVIVSKKSLGY